MTGNQALALTYARADLTQRHARDRAQLLAEIRRLLDYGLTPSQAADELGRTPGAISRTLYRHGPRPLAAKFERARREREAA